MAALASDGIAVDLPEGWDGQIYRRTPDAAFDRDLAPESEGETTGAVLHIANFPLPSLRGDFGSGAVEVMRRQDLLIVLFEYDRASTSTVLFRNKLRLPISADDFDPYRLQHPLPGQGIQHRRGGPMIAVATHMIGAQRVDGDEQDTGRRRRRPARAQHQRERNTKWGNQQGTAHGAANLSHRPGSCATMTHDR